jgi:hypothetical protein
MTRYAVWHKLETNVYALVDYSDETMATLSLFLGDGLPAKYYIEFLEDNHEHKSTFNITTLHKMKHLVQVTLIDDFFAHMPVFITTIENLIKILKAYSQNERALVNEIKVILQDDSVEIISY